MVGFLFCFICLFSLLFCFMMLSPSKYFKGLTFKRSATFPVLLSTSYSN